MNSDTPDKMIRIRISHREQSRNNIKQHPREAFWQPLRENDTYSNRSISSLESQLCRQFGDRLHYSLTESITRSLRDVEKAAYGQELTNVVEELRHFHHFRKSDWPIYPNEPFNRFVEFRQRLIEELPAMRTSLERLLCLSEVAFSTSIQGYGSLDLGITPSSIGQLAKAVTGEFETLQVLLSAFVPQAFAGVFSTEFADAFTYQVAVPESFRDALNEAMNGQTDVAHTTEATPSQATSTTESRLSDAARKAEWVWRLANGSLLVPVILALIVLYFGLKELSSFRNAQYEALKPILEHQMLLLKEDRERMFPKTTVPTVDGSHTKTGDDAKAGRTAPKTDSSSK